MRNATIIRVIVFGSLAILSLLGVQAYWVMKTWDVKEQEFHEKVTVALYRVAQHFEEMGINVPEYDLITRPTSNYYVVNINNAIDANSLEYFLRRELEAVGLTEDFEYGIYDCSNNSMVYGDYISYGPQLDSTHLRKEALPIYDKYIYYFGVRFPNRRNYILSNMGISIGAMAILLLTVAFFVYSLFVILRQKRLSELQKDFINNMTHEFKTPISTIGISANVFLKDETVRKNPRLNQYAHIVLEQSKRLNEQVEKVLQLARIEKGNLQLKPESIHLREWLERVIPGLRINVEERGGVLLCELEKCPDLVKADTLHLTNVLYNLIDNSLKYAGKKQPEIHIRLNCLPQGRVQLCISDNGKGIPSRYKNKVFDKFFRIPTGNVHDVKGFGLGLYYVKNICKKHGWEIALDSEEGQGTKVCIKMKAD
ncbi:sensor histidine kinase [Profundibacter sp.]